MKKEASMLPFSDKDAGISEILDLTSLYITEGFPYRWNGHFILPDGEKVKKHMAGSTAFAFDYEAFSGKAKILNKIRFFFIQNNGAGHSEFFKAMADNESDLPPMAAYMPSYSEIADDGTQFGSIFINMTTLAKYARTMSLEDLLYDLEDTFFHEIRHYYDTLVGIYLPYQLGHPIVDLEMWCDECLNLNGQTIKSRNNTDLVHWGEYDYEMDRLAKFIYLMIPTELNAYTNSFYHLMDRWMKTHAKKFSEDGMRDYMSKNRYEEYPFTIYFLSGEILGGYKRFKRFVDGMTNSKDILNDYFVYFKEFNDNYLFDDRDILKMNDIFVDHYLDTRKASMEEIEEQLPGAFIDFMNEKYIPYTYKKIRAAYKNAYDDMNDILAYLRDKYVKKQLIEK